MFSFFAVKSLNLEMFAADDDAVVTAYSFGAAIFLQLLLMLNAIWSAKLML